MKKSLGVDGLISKFYQTFKEAIIISVIYKLFQKIEKEGTYAKILEAASIILTTKQGKTSEEKCLTISLISIDAKMFNKIIPN